MSERTRLHYPTVYVVHTEDKNRYKSVPDYTVYVGETKVAAARDHVENGLTKAEVMAMHGIASVAPLERWCREYRAGGPEALGPRPKGRPRGSESKPRPEPTREQELAEQVAYLKAKVAYLEKLRALRASKSRGASEAPSSDCSQGGEISSHWSARSGDARRTDAATDRYACAWSTSSDGRCRPRACLGSCGAWD